jgi:hypothetical protein
MTRIPTKNTSSDGYFNWLDLTYFTNVCTTRTSFCVPKMYAINICHLHLKFLKSKPETSPSKKNKTKQNKQTKTHDKKVRQSICKGAGEMVGNLCLMQKIYVE